MEKMLRHRMRRTDRLETLSAYYRVPVCMIMRANDMTRPADIVGLTELKIPQRCYCRRCMAEEKPAVEYCDYTVLPEDTIYTIAKQFGLTMHIIMKTNRLHDPDCIHPGDKLRVPVLSGCRYCVRPGEGIEDIAQRHNISEKTIREINCLEKDDPVYPGMQLVLGS